LAVVLDDFRRQAEWLHRMTVDFVEAIPEERWDFTPDPGGKFGSFARQLRHVVRVRGVYNDALVERRVDWSRSREHSLGSLTREELLAGLHEQQARLLTALDSVDTEAAIDWGGTSFSFEMFTWEFVQHEAIHHGQWSVYAQLAGFETPSSWQQSWKL
jgi:uncharacterized damage-inducible protein DinB